MSEQIVESHVGNLHNDEYASYLTRIQARFDSLPLGLFKTDAGGLWEAYLASFPPTS